MVNAGTAHRGRAATYRYAVAMLGYVWHIWMGIILTGVSIVAVLGVGAGYLKKVTSQQYPGKRHREE
jgi:hypothetical protein